MTVPFMRIAMGWTTNFRLAGVENVGSCYQKYAVLVWSPPNLLFSEPCG